MMAARNPGRRALFGRVVGQHSDIRPVSSHHGKLSVRLKCSGQQEPNSFILESLPRRGEGYPLAIRREGRMRIVAR